MEDDNLEKFEPPLDVNRIDGEDIDCIFKKFQTLHLNLKNAILKSRTKDMVQTKINYHRLKTDRFGFRSKATKELYRTVNRPKPSTNWKAHGLLRKAEHKTGSKNTIVFA